MKKLTFSLCVAIFLLFFCGGLRITAFAQEYYTTIDTQIGYVVNENSLSKVVLKGVYPNKGYYAENVIIEVYEAKTSKLQLTIRPNVNGGYAPKLLLEKFDNGKLDKIFIGMDSGGSGGYGYFYVYDAKNSKQTTLFDFEAFGRENEYTASYADEYKVKVKNTKDGTTYLIDLSLRPKDYLMDIYNLDGKLKTPKQAEVGGVNYVYPYYNTIVGYFQLEVLQRITGLYGADGLGYVSTRLAMENNHFEPYFTTLETFGNKAA